MQSQLQTASKSRVSDNGYQINIYREPGSPMVPQYLILAHFGFKPALCTIEHTHSSPYADHYFVRVRG